MLNIDTFLIRLEEIMENYQLNAAGFAERIGVQRSSVSHILSKRNKPSLEFILKIHNSFEEVKLDWLLLGTLNLSKSPNLNLENKDSIKESSTENLEMLKPLVKQPLDAEREVIVQIIQLYEDGSFRYFFPKS